MKIIRFPPVVSVRTAVFLDIDVDIPWGQCNLGSFVHSKYRWLWLLFN